MKFYFVIPKIGPTRFQLNPFPNPRAYKIYSYLNETFSKRHVNLGLLTVAGLTPNSIEMELVDTRFEEVDFNKECDLVVISSKSLECENAYQIADRFRERNIPVAFGGIHATLYPHDVKKHADFVFVGEAEMTWKTFVQDFVERKAKPIYGEGEQGKNCDITQSPIPRYDLLKKEKYSIIPIQTTRGCPHNCDFCVVSRYLGSRYRFKTIDQIIKELETVLSLWTYPSLFFVDDNMFADKKRSKELLDRLQTYRVKSWMTQCDITVAEDEELLDKIRASQGRFLFIGFESLRKDSLTSVNKTPVKHIRDIKSYYQKCIRTIQKHDIQIFAYFIVGFDEDDITVFDEIRDFIFENKLLGQVNLLMPTIYSKFYEKLIKENRLTDDWQFKNLDGSHVTYIPLQMTKEQMEKRQLELYNEIYNPEFTFELMKQLII